MRNLYVSFGPCQDICLLKIASLSVSQLCEFIAGIVTVGNLVHV
jgi:hypothetical protein